jgi:hypothetical protein
MSDRNYQNDAPALQCASSVASGDTTIPVENADGSTADLSSVKDNMLWTIGKGTSSEEVILAKVANNGTSPPQLEQVERGLQHTSAQSHSQGDEILHLVTEEDLIDKQRASILTARGMPHPSEMRQFIYDDFVGPDGSINNRTTPTGQTWTVQQGDISISGNKVVNSGSTHPAIATLDFGYSSKILGVTYLGNYAQILLWYNDVNNYVSFGTYHDGTRNAYRFREYVSGADTSRTESYTSVGGGTTFGQTDVSLRNMETRSTLSSGYACQFDIGSINLDKKSSDQSSNLTFGNTAGILIPNDSPGENPGEIMNFYGFLY